jgi:hypothetical protein
VRWGCSSSPSRSFCCCADEIGRKRLIVAVAFIGRGSKEDTDADFFSWEVGWERAFFLLFLLPSFIVLGIVLALVGIVVVVVVVVVV